MAEHTRSRAHGRLVTSLGSSIVTGELEPDSDLDPVALESRFGVSRTAVREALLTVEPTAARLAALRRTDRDPADLEDALAAMRSAAGRPAEDHVVIEVGLRLRDQFVHSALTTESADKHAEVLLAVRKQRPKAAEAAMRSLVEKSITDVDVASAAAATVAGRGMMRE